MVRFLIQRPIAVTVTLIAFAVLSLAASGLLPVSLMPAVDIPEIIVKLDAPEKNAREMEFNYLSGLRRRLQQVSHLDGLESYASNGQGVVRMRFQYGTNISYAFIEANELIDSYMHRMPKDFKRPRVIKTSATDVPVFYLNVSMKKKEDEPRFMELSEFTEQVIKKRLEQLPEVAMADISGTEYPEIVLEADPDFLKQMGISRQNLVHVLEESTYSMGNIRVRSGLYEFKVRYVSSRLVNRADIEKLTLKAGDRLFKLKELVKVRIRPQAGKGLVLSDGDRSVALAVIKKSSARMASLKKKTEEQLASMRKDYPRLKFRVEGSQTDLLDYSLGNLESSLWIGGTLAFLIMFLFLRDLKSPLLIGISVPVSLLISLLFFFLLKISVNIISLSGLILGMGMMIDNSIIVIDNIVQHRDRGLSVSDSCVRGTQEVIRPLISSVLTTCAVFIPLIFIPGISGALFYDQAMAISIGLFTSLVVSVTLIPVYFRLFHKNEKQSALSGFFKKIQFYAGLENSYGKGFDWAFRYRKAVLFFCAALLLAGGAAFHEVSKEKFPSLNTHEAVVNIDWNRSVSVAESRRRLEEFFRRQDTAFLAGYSCMAGPQDFLLEKENKMAPSEARVFFRGQTAEGLNKTLRALSDFRREKYPEAVFTVREPETVFEKVFGKEKADVEIRLSSKNRKLPEPETVARIEAAVKKKTGLSSLEKLREQQYFEIIPDFERLSLYSIPVGQLISTTRQAFNRDQIFTLKQGQNRVPVVLSGKRNDLAKVLLAAKIGRNRIPLASLVKLEKHRDYREYAADKNKPYVGRRYRASAEEAEELASAYREALKEFPQIDLDVQGGLLENKTLFSQLAVIFLISVLLLYLILAAQFESLLQPLIVLIEIPIDIAGTLLLLWVTGTSLNLMSLIGMIVMCGIIINDSILKIDTINKLSVSGRPVMEAIHMAGKRRLKPILMTSLTTVLAMIPLLFGNDMGSRLQQPLAVSIIGGMIFGTVVSLYFVPLCYYFFYKKGLAG